MSMIRVSALALVSLALALPGCGGGDDGKTIPRRDARQLLALLNEAERRTQPPLVCGDLLVKDENGTPTLTDLENHVRALPDGVDPDVRDALEESIVRLRQLVDQACAEKETQTTPTETTPTETQPTQTQPTETQPTETQPTETTPTTTGPGGQTAPGEGKKKNKKGEGNGE
jgi:hypothetical protein